MDTSLEQEKEWLLKEKYGGKETPEFFANLEALRNGTPLAYLIGNTPFLGCTIDLSERPLIPRVETEYWVNRFLKNECPDVKVGVTPIQVLDIFAGSGCIGIAVLKNTENTHVDFAEINPNYVKQIEKNLKLNEIATNRFVIHCSDVFENIPSKKFDYILANPPYISRDRMDTVEKSVLDHEDPVALFANKDGLFFIEKLITEAPKYLEPHGKIYIEHGSDQQKVIENILRKNKIIHYEFQKDQYGKFRVFVIPAKAGIQQSIIL